MKIAIIGEGYVGTAYRKLLETHYEVVVYDPIKYPEQAPLPQQELVNQCELAVVCVPTPMGDDGKCDTSIVEDTFTWLKTPLILIKSTIPPGTTEDLANKHGLAHKLFFSPEYIGEGKYFVPFWKYPHPTEPRMHDFMIVGCAPLAWEAAQRVIDIFAAVLGPTCRFQKTNSTTAELCKYMENSWGATKVSFSNEFYEIAKALDVDYQELRELFLMDSRVERMHTMVRADARGFGGKCFPKDVNAIVVAALEHGYTPELLIEVLRSNKKFRGEA